MSKPVVFFSHTSKDKDMVLYIQNRIKEITGNAIDIFMSSDGQSIPFGTNWVHKVEEGLESAAIMFVFVTTSSVKSGWIFFEAGYAYSKGIKVIPVGINIDMGSLRAPLNLLQGFNISSVDSLNNFISIINKQFECSFAESFNDDDYQELISLNSGDTSRYFPLDTAVAYGKFSRYDEYKSSDGAPIKYDIDAIYKKILEYLENNSISYSFVRNNYADSAKEIVTQGVRVRYTPKSGDKASRASNNRAELLITVSPFFFINSFEAFLKLLQVVDDKEKGYINLCLLETTRCLVRDEDISSILSQYPDKFEPKKEESDTYIYKPKNLEFSVFDNSGFDIYSRKKETEYALFVGFDKATIKAAHIIELVEQLSEMKLLRLATKDEL